MPNKNFSDFLVYHTLLINDFLQKGIVNRIENPRLRAITSYSLLAPGKRIRPLLALATMKELGKNIEDEHLKVISALELVHTYSLIHDDLPAMDNDDYRRGKLTSHKTFGEAQAILAGDGLLTMAFNWISVAKLAPTELIQVIQVLTDAVGFNGMIEGQFMDITGTGESLNTEEVKYLQYKKTAELIVAAVKIGCILGGASDQQKTALVNFAEKYGRAFQIYDDLIDVLKEKEEAGKDTRKDQIAGKNTYISAYGIDQAKIDLKALIFAMEQDLDIFESDILIGFTTVFKKVLDDD